MESAYPASHEEALERAMRLIDVIAARPDITDGEVVVALVREGIGELDAELLIRFVPCGLSFALFRRFGVTEVPRTYQVKNAAGQWIELPLGAENYFSAALEVGRDILANGYTERVSMAVFQAVTQRSAEMNVVNQYFNSGGTRDGLAGSEFSPPTLIGLSAERIAARWKKP